MNMLIDIGPQEARLNITYAGQNGDLIEPVPFDASDWDLKTWAREAILGGSVPGIGPGWWWTAPTTSKRAP